MNLILETKHKVDIETVTSKSEIQGSYCGRPNKEAGRLYAELSRM